tara:strand:- start:117 stop:737 length:621 start_codon:yes stop_codon:yes gene_type:complete
MNINIKTFNDWALENKDLNMQKGHESSVNRMFDLIDSKTDVLNKTFSFLDIGCGNGWVVQKASMFENCNLSEGVDGSVEMIKKARKKDSKNNYYIADIESWSPNKKYDIIFSMETFYYFKDPQKIICNLKNYINVGGILIIGVDHYKENTPSLSWEKDYSIKTKTLSIQEWKDCFSNSFLEDLKVVRHGHKEDWLGTLILLGNKKT